MEVVVVRPFIPYMMPQLCLPDQGHIIGIVIPVGTATNIDVSLNAHTMVGVRWGPCSVKIEDATFRETHVVYSKDDWEVTRRTLIRWKTGNGGCE